MFLGVAGGAIERSCYSPHYVNTERDYERDYQAALPQGRTAADGCKPRHGRDDRKRERSFSGLSFVFFSLTQLFLENGKAESGGKATYFFGLAANCLFSVDALSRTDFTYLDKALKFSWMRLRFR